MNVADSEGPCLIRQRARSCKVKDSQPYFPVLHVVCRSCNAYQIGGRIFRAWVFQVFRFSHGHHESSILGIWGGIEGNANVSSRLKYMGAAVLVCYQSGSLFLFRFWFHSRRRILIWTLVRELTCLIKFRTVAYLFEPHDAYKPWRIKS